jgi:fluoride exporter
MTSPPSPPLRGEELDLPSPGAAELPIATAHPHVHETTADLPVEDQIPNRVPWRVFAAIAAGGVIGGPARYGLGLAFPTARGTFPVTTFAINVAGSFVLALLLVFILEIWPPTTYVRPFAAIGFCGAFTTFSTWMVDTDRLLAAGHYGTAVGYVAGSLATGLAASALGFSIGRGFLARSAK